jgi:hypothetical protein
MPVVPSASRSNAFKIFALLTASAYIADSKHNHLQLLYIASHFTYHDQVVIAISRASWPTLVGSMASIFHPV